MAKYCPTLVVGFTEQLAQGLINNLVLANQQVDPDGTYQACCNNATWSVGEIALAFPNEFSNFVSAFVTRFCDLLGSGLVVSSNEKNNGIKVIGI